MKKGIALIILFSTILLSCNAQFRVEKRIYRKGIYIAVKSMNKAKNNHITQIDSSKNDIKPTVTESAFYQNEQESVASDISDTSDLKLTTENLIASTNKNDHFNAPHIHHYRPIDSNLLEKSDTNLHHKRPFFSSSKKILPNSKSEKEPNNRGVAGIAIGVIFLCAGIVIFWWVSMIVGIALFVVGLISLIVGAVRHHNKQPKETQEEMEDVVYLTNGSIIRCSIIEMVVDDYVKIQMRNGSTLVYKMSEVEKITKEKRIK